MAKQKEPKTWAEEIAGLDDPAPKGIASIPVQEALHLMIADFDPEAPDNGASSVEDSEDDIKEAREHYVEVEYVHQTGLPTEL